jgi:hypothetical protein
MIFRPKQLPLTKYERIISEENGHEDEGILEHLRETLPDKSNFFVEFGAGNGLDWLNGRRLIEDHDFGALLIECDRELGAELVDRYSNDSKIRASTTFIRKDNIESIFEENDVPEDLDFLIIDIDSNDYHIWSSIENYRPKVVCIEYNASYSPTEEFIAEYDPEFVWQGDDYFGASIKSYNELAKSKGYSLIHCTSNGENLYFVRNEYLKLLEVEDASPEYMYQLPTMGKYGRAANGKGHPASARNTTATQRSLLKLRYYLTSILRHIG